VRELRNVIERAGSLCDDTTITRGDLVLGRDTSALGRALAPAGPGGDGASASPASPGGFDPALFSANVPFKEAKQQVTDSFEAVYLKHLLDRNKGNITRSAHEAGLTRYHLRELLKRHKIRTG
jgi:DNA-binding NtrC family response regulator